MRERERRCEMYRIGITMPPGQQEKAVNTRDRLNTFKTRLDRISFSWRELDEKHKGPSCSLK